MVIMTDIFQVRNQLAFQSIHAELAIVHACIRCADCQSSIISGSRQPITILGRY